MTDTPKDFYIDDINELSTPAGQPVNISLADYVHVPADQSVKYYLDGLPEGIQLDANTGKLAGIAPLTELNQDFQLQLTVIDPASDAIAKQSFFLIVIGTILLETVDIEENLFEKAMEPENIGFWDAARMWELQQLVQHMINEHFAWIMVFDEHSPPGDSDRFVKQILSKTGWTILEFENSLMISPGDQAFAEYGNRGRLLTTLREVYHIIHTTKNWQTLGFDGSDESNIGRAWIVAKQQGMPVSKQAPTEIAQINYLNLERLYQEFVPKPPQPN